MARLLVKEYMNRGKFLVVSVIGLLLVVAVGDRVASFT